MAKQPIADLRITAIAVPYNINGGHGLYNVFRKDARAPLGLKQADTMPMS